MTMKSRCNHYSFRLAILAALVSTCFIGAASLRAESKPSGALQFSEKVIAGAAGDFIEVRHLTLRGSSFDIGRKLAEVAKQRHGVAPRLSAEPLRTRAQRTYFQKNYPAQFERMRGVAEAFGVKVDNDAVNVSTLIYGLSMGGCSVVFYPPTTTADGLGVLSRNYDFTTGTIQGRVPGPAEVACTSRPYIVEMYPSDGYASLATCAYDLLGSVIDGVNEKGLTLALLADDELQQLGQVRPAQGTQAGFDVIQVGRFLLDTCATVEEAKLALASAKLYYSMIPCHYIVADAKGDSFVWENGPVMHDSHVFEGGTAPLITTNFMHQLHPDARDASKAGQPFPTCPRYEKIRRSIAKESGKFSLDFIKQTNASVMAVRPAPPAPFAPGRTLWHAMYFPKDRKMEVDFYLGETPGASASDPPTIRRSGYLSFALQAQ